MTIFVIWQSIVTLDSIRNPCDVFFVCWQIKIQMKTSWVGWSTNPTQEFKNELWILVKDNITISCSYDWWKSFGGCAAWCSVSNWVSLPPNSGLKMYFSFFEFLVFCRDCRDVGSQKNIKTLKHWKTKWMNRADNERTEWAQVRLWLWWKKTPASIREQAPEPSLPTFCLQSLQTLQN